MFGIGYQEMFIVLVVALVIFGPSRLPELAGQVGRWVRDFRRMSSDLTGEFEKTFAEVDEVKKTFKREMQGIQDEVEGVGKSARGDLKKSGTKSIAAGKKPGGAAAKTGTAAGATGSSPTRASSLSKTAKSAGDVGANGAGTKAAASARDRRAGAARQCAVFLPGHCRWQPRPTRLLTFRSLTSTSSCSAARTARPRPMARLPRTMLSVASAVDGPRPGMPSRTPRSGCTPEVPCFSPTLAHTEAERAFDLESSTVDAAGQGDGARHVFAFRVLGIDRETGARRGRMATGHGVIETPAFMPVGTQATIKTLLPEEVRGTGAQIILANTYHLMLRPGLDTLVAAGGLHRFMGWDGPILTDSGGFQIFSLAGNARVRESGVTFRSHIDGSHWELSPETAVGLQLGWGSDIVMALDQLVGLPADAAIVRDATDRTHRWLMRCIAAFVDLGGQERAALFGICQGGMDPELRRASAEAVADADVAGCAIGGLSVGEPKPVMAEMLEIVADVLPVQKPRYLMGVGSPEDLWMGVARGVDLFDCVLPTRLARNGALFTPEGRVNIKQRRFATVHAPLDSECDCDTCTRFSAAYLHHLFRTKEVLGLRLASVHNLRFLARQIEAIRRAIERNAFRAAHESFLERYRPVGTGSIEHAG